VQGLAPHLRLAPVNASVLGDDHVHGDDRGRAHVRDGPAARYDGDGVPGDDTWKTPHLQCVRLKPFEAFETAVLGLTRLSAYASFLERQGAC